MTYILGLEGGGTKTTAVLLDGHGTPLARAQAAAANASLHSPAQIAQVFRAVYSQIKGSLPRGATLTAGLCLAGVIDGVTEKKVFVAAQTVFPARTKIHVSSDLVSALYGAFGQGEGIIAIAGTGSCVFGMKDGHHAKSGGGGHLLGDAGSAYWIAHQALRGVFESQDHHDHPGESGRRILRALSMSSVHELVAWAHAADKAQMAQLAPEVIAAAEAGDKDAAQIVSGACARIARHLATVQRKIAGSNLPVALRGGLFEHRPFFRGQFARELRRLKIKARIIEPFFDGATGAALFALGQNEARMMIPPARQSASHTAPIRDQSPGVDLTKIATEDRNPRTVKLSKLSTRKQVALMIDEDERFLFPALRAQSAQIARAVDFVARKLHTGGRLFYVGAGTSGRLGILDASECPPTFSVPAEMVQGIIAGGARAMTTGIEGAEDHREAGAAVIRDRGVTAKDIVFGIAASGRTPFVWAALEQARKLRAGTVILSCNPKMRGAEPFAPDVSIHLPTGPESLTGSTRLRAGTATKLVLNMITTLSMVQTGKVISNYMIDVSPTNEKLRSRAVRIVSEISGRPPSVALEALKAAGWNLRKALAREEDECSQ